MIILSLLRQLHRRWKARSPKYARILTTVSLVLAIIIGLPEFLNYMEINVPTVLEPILSKAIAVAGFLSAALLKLTVENQENEKVTKEN